MARADTEPAAGADATDSPREGVGGARFRPISNPATGERIEFTDIPGDGGEDLVRFDWQSLPGGAVPEHIHPHQEERFIITSGEAHFTLDGAECIAGPGETVVVAAGVAHSQGNHGTVAIEGIVELRPGLKTRQLQEAFAGLAADGMATARGAPKNPLQLGATMWYFRRESRVTAPPVWAQNVILPPLSALAKLFRMPPYYGRWNSQA